MTAIEDVREWTYMMSKLDTAEVLIDSLVEDFKRLGVENMVEMYGLIWKQIHMTSNDLNKKIEACLFLESGDVEA